MKNKSKHYLYRTWRGMLERCYNSNCGTFALYGGRGIKVSKQWILSFDNFVNDMGEKPTAKHFIDRINNNGHYEPSNCRWATPKEQRDNSQRNDDLLASRFKKPYSK